MFSHPHALLVSINLFRDNFYYGPSLGLSTPCLLLNETQRVTNCCSVQAFPQDVLVQTSMNLYVGCSCLVLSSPYLLFMRVQMSVY